MTTDAELADALYPTMAAQAATHASEGVAVAAPEAKSVTEQQNEEAAKLYTSMQPKEAPAVNVPENIKALRESDDNRAFDPQVMLKGADIEGVFANVEGVDDATKAVAAAEWREIAADIGASVSDVNQFLELARQTSAEGRPSDETLTQWEAATHKRLSEVYGAEAAHALAQAKALTTRDPRVRQLLHITGLGSHPDTVVLFAQLAAKEKLRGRL